MARTIQSLTLSEMDCKGRNGYFNHGRTEIWSSGNPVDGITIYVQVYSKKTGQSPPLQFHGPVAVILQYFAELARNCMEVSREAGGNQ
jgi:hypothetical protein